MHKPTKDAELIKVLGGPSRVAQLLGLPKVGGAQRVQNWLSRGIPAHVKVDRPDLFMPELVALNLPKIQHAQLASTDPTNQQGAAHA